MRQVLHKKPPFYCPSTRRVSYKVYSLTSFTNAVHEQTLLKLNDMAWYSDLQEVEKRSDLSPQEELPAAKNRSFWSTVRNEESSMDLLTKRLTAKASLEVGQRQGWTTREVEVIWWPDLYSTTRNGKLSIRFYIKIRNCLKLLFINRFFTVYSILIKHSGNGFKVDFTSLKYLGSCFSSIFYLQRAVLLVKLPCLTCTEVNFVFLFFSASLKCKLDIDIILFAKCKLKRA